MATSVGDEGGFAPDLPSNAAALEVIAEAVANAGYVLGEDITLALDCAASEFYRDGEYHLSGEGRSFSSEGFSDYLADLAALTPSYRLRMVWMNLTGLVGLTSPSNSGIKSNSWVMIYSLPTPAY